MGGIPKSEINAVRAPFTKEVFSGQKNYIDHVGTQLIRWITFLCACCLVALPACGRGSAVGVGDAVAAGARSLFGSCGRNGVTVAVGRNGTVITSTDGVEWRTSHTGAEYSLIDVVWGNGLFVAVGGESGVEFTPGLGVILTSDDGFNWIERHREDYLTLEAVVWTGTRFVAVGIGDGVLLAAMGCRGRKCNSTSPSTYGISRGTARRSSRLGGMAILAASPRSSRVKTGRSGSRLPSDAIMRRPPLPPWRTIRGGRERARRAGER